MNEEKKYDILVFIGRFQPFHMGHKRVVDTALELAHNVLLLVGGAGKARSPRNPWTYEERRAMIKSVYPASANLFLRPIHDTTYNDDAWLEQVQDVVNDAAKDIFGINNGWSALGLADLNIGLIGCKKDNTSYYIDLFPQWASEPVQFLSPLNATAIRQILFERSAEPYQLTDNVLPQSVCKILVDRPEIGFPSVEIAEQMIEEYEYYKSYRQRFPKHTVSIGNDSFDVQWQHNCADAIVVQSGHVLLIKRRANPGKGLWAIPGGFKHADETYLSCALRELREETKLKVPEPVLRGSIEGTMDADDPHRSERGTVMSKVFLFKLPPGPLPKVKGSDDASKAKWVPLADLREDMMFEDHYHLIRNLTKTAQ